MKNIHKFQIIDISILKVNFSRNAGLNSKDEKDAEGMGLPAQLNWNSEYSKEEKIIRTVLKASIGNETSPFTIAVEMGGIFLFESPPEEKQLDMLQNVNCPAIVFPYLREYISDLTKRAGFTPLFLPPSNFVEAHKQKKKEQE